MYFYCVPGFAYKPICQTFGQLPSNDKTNPAALPWMLTFLDIKYKWTWARSWCRFVGKCCERAICVEAYRRVYEFDGRKRSFGRHADYDRNALTFWSCENDVLQEYYCATVLVKTTGAKVWCWSHPNSLWKKRAWLDCAIGKQNSTGDMSLVLKFTFAGKFRLFEDQKIGQSRGFIAGACNNLKHWDCCE